MPRKAIALSPEVAAVLAAAHIDDRGALRLTAQLDRAVYVNVDKALRALGGKWNRSAKAHIFMNGDADALQKAIADALGTGEIIDKKKSLEQFDTPPDLAARMVAMAEISPGNRILEPSAGLGNLLRPIDPDEVAGEIVAVEIDRERCEVLWDQFPWVDTYCLDFLNMGALGPVGDFDVVLMNPPFANNADIKHVQKAWSLLRPGGRLVAIIGPHSSFGSDRASRDFRRWFEAPIEDLPPGTFGDSGTMVGAQLIKATKQ